MSLKRYSISNLLIFALLFGYLFIIQHIEILGVNPYTYITIPQLIVSSLFFIAISVVLYLYERKQSGIKLNLPLLTMLGVVFIIMLIVTLVCPNEFTVLMCNFDLSARDVPIYISNEMKAIFIMVNFFSLLLIYIVIDVLPKKIKCLKQLNLFFILLIALCAGAIIYSLFTEINKYGLFFTNISTETSDLVSSFTNNPNNYGSLILFGIISCLFMHNNNKKFYWYLVAIVLYIFLIPTMSRTSILCATLIICLYLIFRCILSYKNNVKRNTITLACVLIPIVTFASFYIAYLVSGKTFDFVLFKKIDSIFENLISKNTLNSRLVLWNSVIHILDAGYWVTGMGFGLFSGVFLQAVQHNYGPTWQSDSPHNGLFQILGSGGIILLILFVIALAYLIYAMVKIYKNHKSLVFLNISVILGLFLHMFFEGTTPLIASSPVFEYLIWSIIIFVPTLSTYYHDVHNKDNIAFKRNYSHKKDSLIVKDQYYISESIMFFLTPISNIFLTLMFTNPNDFIFAILAIVFGGLFLIAPLSVEIIVKKRSFSFKQFSISVLLPYLIIYIAYALVAVLPATFVEKSLVMTLMLTILPCALYFAFFMLIPYLQIKSGIVRFLLDNVNRFIAFYIASGIEKVKCNQTMTLYERIFSRHK